MGGSSERIRAQARAARGYGPHSRAQVGGGIERGRACTRIVRVQVKVSVGSERVQVAGRGGRRHGEDTSSHLSCVSADRQQ